MPEGVFSCQLVLEPNFETAEVPISDQGEGKELGSAPEGWLPVSRVDNHFPALVRRKGLELFGFPDCMCVCVSSSLVSTQHLAQQCLP